MIRGVFRDGVIHPTEPVPPEWADGHEVRMQEAVDSLRDEFERLSAEWKSDTRFTSSTREIATHRAYQRVIGMGVEAVPLILEDLRKEPHWWFWALRAITGEDPTPPSAKGKLRDMAEAWIDWGTKRGLLSSDVP